MDPLSQGVVGSVAAQNSAQAKRLAIATLFGLIGGMAPDLDVFIRSETDPIFFLEYHRQFTHSLIFIPIGGLICALVLHALIGRFRGLSFKQSALYTTAGYATHALLDACTSYGTQLWWPFSNMRVAWSNMPIVDPIFTLPILFLVIFAVIRKNPNYARAALIWIVLYLGFGIVQRERAEQAGWALAESRQHSPGKVEVKPSFGNTLVWKVIYELEDRYYVDGVRVGLNAIIYPGRSIPKLDVKRDFPWLGEPQQSQQAKDIERFRWFSQGYLAVSPDNPLHIIDARYSMLPNEVQGLWMIELDPDAAADEHVQYIQQHKDARAKAARLWEMLLGD